MRVRFPVSRIVVSIAVVRRPRSWWRAATTTTSPARTAPWRASTVDAPDSATSGQNFDIHVTAQDIGVQNVQNGVVTVTLPSPLTVVSLNAESGTTATFSGSTVTWNLGTLDANTQSELTITPWARRRLR